MNKVECLSQLVDGDKYRVFNALVALNADVSRETSKKLTLALTRRKKLFELSTPEEIIAKIATSVLDEYESYCVLIDNNKNLTTKAKAELIDFELSSISMVLEGLGYSVEDMLN